MDNQDLYILTLLRKIMNPNITDANNTPANLTDTEAMFG